MLYEQNRIETYRHILQVPHHGDVKALTDTLVRKLRPSRAVISCEAAYIERKNRPSRAAAGLLEKYGVRYWFTDCFSADWHAPDYWKALILQLMRTGRSPARTEGSYDYIRIV